MPEAERPKMADYYEDYEGPDRPQSWRDVIDWRRAALLAGVSVYMVVMFALPFDNVLQIIFEWVCAMILLAAIVLGWLYFVVRWAIRFVLKH